MGRAATNADEPAVHRAVATVNSLGLAIALRGTLGYLAGATDAPLPPGTLGWPFGATVSYRFGAG